LIEEGFRPLRKLSTAKDGITYCKWGRTTENPGKYPAIKIC
jgi:hypothetical protein